MNNIKIVLPFPPSVDGLYGGGSGQKRFPSKRYKAWLNIVPELEPFGIKGPVKIKYTYAWPDARRRDGQNYMKATTDYLVKQGVLEDDNWKVVGGETWDHVGIDRKNPRVEIEIIQEQPSSDNHS